MNAVVSALSALPGTGQSLAATRAMTRFSNHDQISFPALLEPAQDGVRIELTSAGQENPSRPTDRGL